MIFPVYLLVKYLAYSWWCYLGLRWLRDRKSVGAGFAFGSVRLGLGMIFGVVILCDRRHAASQCAGEFFS